MRADPAAITARRHAAHLSQAELARRAGTSPAYLSRIEAGLMTGTVEVLARIAAALAVPLADITTPDGTYRPSRATA